jgi:DNA-binding winged helix-turn-helix (wHTH) protein
VTDTPLLACGADSERTWAVSPVSKDTSYRTNAVRITISKLRSKLGDPARIETLPGEGYRIAAGPERNR